MWGINPDDLKGKVPPFMPDHEVIRQTADYLGEVMAFDAIGVLIDELKKQGSTRTPSSLSRAITVPGFPRGKTNPLTRNAGPAGDPRPKGIKNRPGRDEPDLHSRSRCRRSSGSGP